MMIDGLKNIETDTNRAISQASANLNSLLEKAKPVTHTKKDASLPQSLRPVDVAGDLRIKNWMHRSILIFVIGVIGLWFVTAVILPAPVASRPSRSLYEEAGVDPGTKDIFDEVAKEPVRTEEAPPVGTGRTLYGAQIRYCVFENERIELMQQYLGGNGSDWQIDTFNRYVNDYNSRCSDFRYRQGSLQSIQAELPSVRTRLRSEARNRLE